MLFERFSAKNSDFTTKQNQKKSKKGLANWPGFTKVARKCWFKCNRCVARTGTESLIIKNL